MGEVGLIFYSRRSEMRHMIRDTFSWRRVRPIALACCALPLLAACGGGGPGSSSMNLGITDGPVDSASSVVVSFTGVELQPSGGGNAITFNFSSAKTIDLLQEQNGNQASLLSGASVPPGNYDWIRLLVSAAANGTVANSYIEVNGAQYPLIIPSGAQTGLKLVQGFTMAVGQQANFTIDFMLQQSITAPPGQTTSGGLQEYILKPALRLVNDEQVGTISGSVALATLQGNSTCLPGGTTGTGPLPNAHVYIYTGTLTSLSSTLTPLVEPEIMESSSGFSYDQAFLPTGPYTLAVACTSTSSTGATTVAFLPANGVTATVTANQTTPVNF